jgi:bifunctional non-homologous end joining protein LigD
MLATSGDLPAEPGWAHEGKYDGVRAVSYTNTSGGLRILSRSGRDITRSYPEIGILPSLFPGHCVVLDGELVTLDAGGTPSFNLLQSRIVVMAPGKALLASAPVLYLVFDLLFFDEPLVALPWSDRRAALEQLDLNRHPIAVPPVFYSDPDLLLEAAAEQGLEGVVSKRVNAPYQPGRRSPAWIKLAISKAQEGIIIGWREGEGGRSGTFGSVLLAAHGPDGRLDFIGAVGSGFTDRMLQEMQHRLKQLEIPTSATTGRAVPREYLRGAHWCKPVLVGEAQYRHWTLDGTMRHVSWRGLRPEKNPRDVKAFPTQRN